MNVNKRIRVIASAVIFAGAITVGLTTPRVALAASCSSYDGYKCDVDHQCPAFPPKSSCAAFAPHGCIVIGAQCFTTYCSSGFPTVQINCAYTDP